MPLSNRFQDVRPGLLLTLSKEMITELASSDAEVLDDEGLVSFHWKV